MTEDDAAWRGRIIDDRYAVDAVLGRGGMGVVLRARHRFTGAWVALKVLREDLAADVELQRRFLAEARASNAIAHPGIVEVLDAGRDPAGGLYLAMELLTGESLRPVVRRGALPGAELQRIGAELGAALGAAHARGFVHRDLKPENVFLVAPSGAVKLLDFGIAKVLAADLGAQVRTAAGVVMGTPAYMAPEQLRDARAVDARADLWALGVMLYEMMTGRLPFRGATHDELFLAIATSEPEPIATWLPAAPATVSHFFARALARDPTRRFGSAAELTAALAALPPISARPTAATPVAQSVLASGFTAAPALAASVPPATPPPVDRTTSLLGTELARDASRRRHALWLGGAVVVAVAGVVVAYVATKPSSRPAPVAAVAPAASDAPSAPSAPSANAADPATPPVDAAAPPADAAIASRPPLDAGADVAPPRHPVTVPGPVDAAVADAPPPAHAPPDVCAAGCALATRCGLGYAQCAATCARRADVTACMRDASSCNGAAACGFLAVCGLVPQGAQTCNQVSAAQGLCAPGDPSCACRLAARLAPSHAQALALYDACAASCAADARCVATRCAAPKRNCLAQ